MNSEHIKHIVIHCSATIYTQNKGVDDIRIEHMRPPRNWSDVGYHKVIKRDGTIENGRALDRQGAHAKGYNEASWGICLIGGLDLDGVPEANYTIEQYRALIKLLLQLKDEAPQAEILGHRDLSPDLNQDGKISRNEFMKECPCFNVKAFWGEHNENY
ncbi:MAG: N-acetylmuramoyl-L-alanine amidase [Gammaproteobacteria bacterium]|nr:MAG: N-acetylmuramoyl-L-alanine amidase [Gammaproteobacteria bacterium]